MEDKQAAQRRKEQDDLISLSNSNVDFAEFVKSAPQAVSVLGQVLLVANAAEFNLEVPVGGFKHVKWQTFRAAMLQAVGECHGAFVTADTNMKRISDRSNEMPEIIAKIIEALLSRDPTQARYVPMLIEDLRELSQQCQDNSTKVVDAFSSSLLLLIELHQATIATQGTEQQKREQVKADIAAREAIQKHLQELANYDKALADKLTAQVDHFKDKLDKAYDDIPEAMEVFGMNMLSTVSHTLTSMLNPASLTSLLSIGGGLLSGGADGGSISGILGSLTGAIGSQAGGKPDKPSTHADDGSYPKKTKAPTPTPGLRQANQIDQQVSRLRTAVGPLGSALPVQEIRTKGVLLGVSSTLTVTKESIESDHATDPDSVDAVDLCTSGIEIANRIVDLANSLSGADLAEVDKLRTRADEVFKTSTRLVARAANVMRDVDLPKTKADSSGTDTESEEEGDPSGNLGDDAVKMAYKKVSIAKAAYESALSATTDASKNYHESSTKLANVIAELAKLKIKEIDFEKIRVVLVKAVESLGQLTKQWTLLELFFKSINALVETASSQVSTFLKRTVSVSENNKEAVLADFERSLVLDSARRADKSVLLVHTVSSLYKDISTTYIVKPIGNLFELSGLGADKPGAIEAGLINLKRECEEAQRAIDEAMDAKYAAYNKQLKARVVELTEQLDKMAVPKDVKESIDSAVSSASATE